MPKTLRGSEMNLIESDKTFFVVDAQELEILKEALDSFYAQLVMVIKDITDDIEEARVTKLMEKTEAMCKFLKVEGY